jgi:hypothetical protein
MYLFKGGSNNMIDLRVMISLLFYPKISQASPLNPEDKILAVK